MGFLQKFANNSTARNRGRPFQGAMEAKEREFEAYKNHTNELLEKEKFLNKRLRQYSLKIDKQ